MVGPGAAGTAYIPGLADYVPMVKGVGSLALGGPALVKAVSGQEIAEQPVARAFGGAAGRRRNGLSDQRVRAERNRRGHQAGTRRYQ